MKKLLSKVSLRWVVQLLVVFTVVGLSVLHLTLGIEKAAPIDAYCPFGAVESFFTLVFKGEFLKRIFTSSFILLGIFFVATLFLGRIFCGYFCPLGAIQEWLRFLGKKLGLKKDRELPKEADQYLRYFKYLVLGVIVYFSFYLGDLIFRNYDPYNALMHLGNELQEKPVGYAILAIIIVVSLFSKSLWCRYFCPLGAFFGIIKKISFLKIKRNAETCIGCGSCNAECSSDLEIKTAKEIKSADCISCSRCIEKCPKSSLSYVLFKKEIKKKNFAILIVVLVILPLLIAPQTPFWKTKAESNLINAKGELNTLNIRGSNTLKYVIETTKVPLSEFQKKLNLPKELDVNLKLKEIGLKYALKNKDGNLIETEDFRIVVEDYLKEQEQKQEQDKEQEKEVGGDCSFGQVDCGFPGDCGRYVDVNKDEICDHSQ